MSNQIEEAAQELANVASKERVEKAAAINAEVLTRLHQHDDGFPGITAKPAAKVQSRKSKMTEDAP